jgi:hypothetical protein
VSKPNPAAGQKMPRATPAMNDDIASAGIWIPSSRPQEGHSRVRRWPAYLGWRCSAAGTGRARDGDLPRLAACIADPRDPARVIHRLDDILRARVFAIACGYEDADDLDALRDDPGFRLALGKLPGSGAGLASQPTMSRWENAPTTRELARMMAAMIDIYCASYPAPPTAVTLDIDDTCDVVHGYQQLSFWNGHHGERCFLPIHIYDTATGRPVAMLLRTGKTPSGGSGGPHPAPGAPPAPALARYPHHHPRRRALWPTRGHGLLRGGRRRLRVRPAHQRRAARRSRHRCCRRCLRGQAGPAPVSRPAQLCRDPLRREELEVPAPRRRPDRGQHAGHGHPLCRHLAGKGSAEHIYDTLYCARGQAENLIKRHKSQLASDRTSCRSANANQMRLILHTAAYWLLWRIQQAIPGPLLWQARSLPPCACGCSRSLRAS